MTALAYANALTTPLVYDDVPLVVGNALLRTRAGLWTLLQHARMTSAPIWPGHYRPLLMATVWLQYQLAGTAPWSWRAVNLVLHLANGVLVYALVWRVLARLGTRRAEWAAVAAASLWLLHPVNAIVVDLVLKRNTSLCALFMLVALLLLVRRTRAAYVGALAAGVAAVLTKEDAAALPLLAALVAAADGQRLRRALPFAVAPLGAAVVALGRVHHGGALAYLCAQPLALARYLEMLVHPTAIAAAYDLEPRVTALRLVGVAAVAAVAVAALAMRRRAPRLAFAVGWALAALLPSSSLVPIAPTMDEVRVYLAFVFVFALGGVVLSEVRYGWAAALVAAVLAWRATLEVNARWHEPVTLWAHAVEQYPSSKIGTRALCEATNDPAICGRAVALWPDDPYARYDLVAALARAGRLDDAARAVAAAQRLLPSAPMVALAAGHLAWLRDDDAAAERAYRAVLAADPMNDSARIHLADVLASTGRTDEARALVAALAGVRPADAADAALLDRLRARLR